MRWILALCLLSDVAWADDVHVDVGISFRRTSAIDLARFADASGFGSGSDTSPGALGLRVGLSYALDDLVEFALDGRIGAGGLALGETEVRYFGAADTIGSSVSAELGGHALFKTTTDDWTFLLGPGAVYHLMTAASGPGSVGIRATGLGVRGGVRWRTHQFASGYGYLQLDADTYWHLTQRVFAQGGGDPKFDTASDRGYLSTGFSLVYGWAFSLFHR